jgi:hypothetical protein
VLLGVFSNIRPRRCERSLEHRGGWGRGQLEVIYIFGVWGQSFTSVTCWELVDGAVKKIDFNDQCSWTGVPVVIFHTCREIVRIVNMTLWHVIWYKRSTAITGKTHNSSHTKQSITKLVFVKLNHKMTSDNYNTTICNLNLQIV